MTVEADPRAGDALTTVLARNDFYRDGHSRLMRIVLLEAVAIVVLVIALVLSLVLVKPERTYFATYPNGSIVPLVPLDQPNLANDAVIGWVVQAVTETMTFGFHDWRDRLNHSMRHFTSGGRESFMRALQSAGLLDAVQTRRQVISSAPWEAPVIIEEGVDRATGQYRWIVQFPLNMTIQSGNKSDAQRYRVTIAVVRVSELESDRGLGIQQWITERMN